MSFRVVVVLPSKLERQFENHPDFPFEITQELKAWITDGKSSPEYLIVEAGKLGVVGLGPTLELRPLSNNELKPNVSMGLYDDWEDDLGLPWAFPLSVYKRQE
jgi:hypothetical protein